MTDHHDDAWNDFWANNAATAHHASGGGCLPDRWRRIETAQRQVWREFATQLPEGGHVLDLATGDGRVMRWLLEERPDLKLVGVDLAPQVPAPPAGTRIETGVAMEELPFLDRQFDAAVSQFGFEYGDTARVAAELARVVKPGGAIGLITHRIDGPILEHNMQRSEAIRWAIEEHSLIEVAKRSLAQRAQGMITTSSTLANAPAAGARRFGPESAAWEIAEAIRRTLQSAAGQPDEHVMETLELIEAQARNELGRIVSLQAACARTADDAAFLARIGTGGLHGVSRMGMAASGEERTIADFRVLRHL